ncbi:MAG: GTPase Era [Wenzhouxiangellaceae bacterium]
MNRPEPETMHCGTVAVIGRPNVGKSTLLNRLVGERVSIVTHKPQTTRHRITGIVTRPEGQIVLIDTPGLHRRRDHALNRHMNRVAAETLHGVDLALLVLDASHQTDEDEAAARAVAQCGLDVVLVFNKIDRLQDRGQLLPMAGQWSAKAGATEVFFVSALKGEAVEELVQGLITRLPIGPPMYQDEQFTIESMRFLAAELVREQLLENLHQEIPYGTTVLIERFVERGEEGEPHGMYILATILVAEQRHKGMVIGKGGQTLKRIGTRARLAMQELFDSRVRLELNVRVEPDWMDRERELHRYGYRR